MEDTYYALQNRYCTNDGHAQSHSNDGTDRTATVTIKVVPGANSHGIQNPETGTDLAKPQTERPDSRSSATAGGRSAALV